MVDVLGKSVRKGETVPLEGRGAMTKAEFALRSQFETLFFPSLESAETSKRHLAFDRFSRSGLPGRNVESWCYTDLRRAMSEAYAPAKAEDALAPGFDYGPDIFGSLPGPRLVIVNGFLHRDLSDLSQWPAGVEMSCESGVGRTGKPHFESGGVIGDLNMAFAEEELVLRVQGGNDIALPLHLIVISGGERPLAAHSRVHIDLGDGAKLRVIETCLNVSAIQATHVLDYDGGKGAHFDHVRLQNLSDDAQFLSVVKAGIASDSHFSSFLFAIGGALARSETEMHFYGENARGYASGVALLSGKAFCDISVSAYHSFPRCVSRESHKFVLDDEAHGVFHGHILVHPQAQETDGKQSSHALLLSERSEMNIKPELEIYADDVQCGHGSTSGRLDEVALFYLCARGISEDDAKSMLVLAFVGEVLEEIADEDVRSVLSDYARIQLSKAD
ncbi:MAG: Fe-S cluster assembly protein SufD [Alphaproteobacteria bacterium]|nr:Fe-S cluster assembly protein SufD [Alphaproteobacteria bacterium]